jgi:hypothetical protein
MVKSTHSPDRLPNPPDPDPLPRAGGPRARVHWVDTSVTEAAGVITRWGAGTGKLVKAMRSP